MRTVRRTLTCILVCFFLLAGFQSPASVEAGNQVGVVDRAVWVWEEDSFGMLDDPSLASDAIGFLHSYGFDTVYLYADRYEERDILSAEPEKYRSLIGTLHEEGFEVHALLGSIYLHTEEYVLPEKRELAYEMLRRVLVYNQDSPDTAKFDGVNVDVEPYIMDAWDTEPVLLARYYLEMSRRYMEMKEEYGFTGAIGPALPFWYDGITVAWEGEERPLNQHVQDIYDYVSLMDYRDQALGSDGIVRHARREVVYGDSVGKDVIIGLETKSGDLSKVTFHDDTWEDLAREMDLTVREFKDHSSFDGFAIHHYGTFREWIEQQK